MYNAFVNFGDIKGESTDKDHKDWVVISKYELGATLPTSGTQGAGTAAGRVSFSEFKITKLVDAASPKLYEACCKGTHIPEVTIELWRSGGNAFKYFEIKLKEVIISGVNETADSGGEAKSPTEVVGLTFGAIEWTYTKQKPDGTAGGSVTAQWSVVKGAPA